MTSEQMRIRIEQMRIRIAELEEEVRQLRDTLLPPKNAPLFGYGPAESRILRAIAAARGKPVSTERLIVASAMRRDTDPAKLLQIIIYNMRRRNNHRKRVLFRIESERGYGYWLSPPDCETVLKECAR